MSKNTKVGTVLGNTKVVAVGLDDARRLITFHDDFIKNQSKFDRQSRLRLPSRSHTVSEDDYLTFLKTQVRPWSAGEIDALTTMFKSIDAKFAGLRVHLPDTVHLIKTSGQEEGFSAYTRRDDTIVMSETKVALINPGAGGDALHPQPNLGALEDIYIHEFFHLISKNNPDLRHGLYGQIGYRQFDQPIALPETPWRGETLATMKITNPDTPVLNVVIEMELPDAQPGEVTPLMPVLLAKESYESGIFFDHLDWVFLVLDETAAGWQLRLDSDGEPIVVPSDSAGLEEKYKAVVGQNISEEIFHPDEILAQNFVLVINEPSLGILNGIADAIHQDA